MNIGRFRYLASPPADGRASSPPPPEDRTRRQLEAADALAKAAEALLGISRREEMEAAEERLQGAVFDYRRIRRGDRNG